MKHYILFVLVGAMLCACGPKIVGEDTPKADNGATNAANEPEVQLRYPMSGKSVDQRLYYLNQPQNMEYFQLKQRQEVQRRFQKEKAPNDYNNLQPKQVSPFRQ